MIRLPLSRVVYLTNNVFFCDTCFHLMQSKYPVQIDYSMGTKKTDTSPFEQAWFVSQFGSHHLWLGPSWFAARMSRDIHSAHFINLVATLTRLILYSSPVTNFYNNPVSDLDLLIVFLRFCSLMVQNQSDNNVRISQKTFLT